MQPNQNFRGQIQGLPAWAKSLPCSYSLQHLWSLCGLVRSYKVHRSVPALSMSSKMQFLSLRRSRGGFLAVSRGMSIDPRRRTYQGQDSPASALPGNRLMDPFSVTRRVQGERRLPEWTLLVPLFDVHSGYDGTLDLVG